MALSRIAKQHAAEIRNHDWSDAPYRIDRAGHSREDDRGKRTVEQLSPGETDRIRLNVIWTTAQVLAYNDPNFNVHEFAEAAGAPGYLLYRSDGKPSGGIAAGLRIRYDEDANPTGPWMPGLPLRL